MLFRSSTMINQGKNFAIWLMLVLLVSPTYLSPSGCAKAESTANLATTNLDIDRVIVRRGSLLGDQPKEVLNVNKGKRF